MKKIIFLFVLFSFCSCKKESGVQPATGLASLAKGLSADKDFISFTGQYFQTMADFSAYQRTTLGTNLQLFIKEIGETDNLPGSAEKIYLKYGVNFGPVLTYQNKLDNAFLQLFSQRPDLLELTKDDFSKVMVDAISLGIDSDEPGWSRIKTTLAPAAGNIGPVALSGKKPFGVKLASLTGAEVWGCLKDAVGLNFATQFGLKEIAVRGIKILSEALTKTLAEFAGPIGAGIMAAEFGFCLYEQSED